MEIVKDAEAYLKAKKYQTAPEQSKITVDPSTGQAINPNVPSFIAKAPWYMKSSADDSLISHRKIQDNTNPLDSWYKKGFKGPAATKFRKGACGNCGAASHKTKDCLERPRKVGAKWNGQDIQADELVSSVDLHFEAKRDRWNGYDPNEHTELIKDWEMVEEKRKQLREEKAKTKGTLQESSGSSEDDSDDEKYADSANVVGQKVDTKSRVTVRNLRIREDTAKYLLNLDVNSAQYDPKTRSMRDPSKSVDPDEFIRSQGDTQKMSNMQAFAWEAEKRGKDVHLNANPTMGEILYKQYQEKQKGVTNEKKSSIIEKYGGEEHLNAPPKELLLAQTENYVEYSKNGQIIKGQEKPVVKSIYLEDVYPSNHTSVWGSWWFNGNWGYKCCESTIRASYCTGQAGIDAAKDSIIRNYTPQIEFPKEVKKKSILDDFVEKASHSDMSKESKKRAGDKGHQLDPKKLKAAVERERTKKGENKYNSLNATNDVTEEELEAYRLERKRADDPMANYIDYEDA